jgi:hypothetical protein
MIEDWIKDMESRHKTIPSEQLAYYLDILCELKKDGEYVGEVKFSSESSFKEQLFCYHPKNRQGIILERSEKGPGSVTSYGNISREDFLKNYPPFSAREAELKTASEKLAGSENVRFLKKQETKKKVKKYTLLALPVVVLSAAYIGLKKFLGQRSKE